LPSTPAPAIWVVGVTSDRVDALGADPDPQPPHVTTNAAAIETATAAIDCLPSTRPTLTSGDFGADYDSL
jgi:hypothetical protein